MGRAEGRIYSEQCLSLCLLTGSLQASPFPTGMHDKPKVVGPASDKKR